jgi:hypothetical protein
MRAFHRRNNADEAGDAATQATDRLTERVATITPTA